MSIYSPPQTRDVQVSEVSEKNKTDDPKELEDFERQVEIVKQSFVFGGSNHSLSGKKKKEKIREEILRLLRLKPRPLNGSLQGFTIKDVKEIFVVEYGFARSFLKGEVEQKNLVEKKGAGSIADVYILSEDYHEWNRKQDTTSSTTSHDTHSKNLDEPPDQENSKEDASHKALQGVRSEKIKIQQKITSLTDALKKWERIEDEILALLSRNQS